MKLPRLLLSCAFAASAALAQNPFPGLQKVLSEAEWQRAGLDRLTPDQLGVIDAALIRFHLTEQKRLLNIVETPITSEPPPGASAVEAAVLRSRYWERFGLEKLKGDWREQPPMKAKVTSWLGANRFALDTGQVWEGQETIPFEILGQQVTIAARPMGAYALTLGEDSMSVRVRRVR